jgi:serine/threonine protein kinase
MADMTGRTIGNYQLIQYLARGDSSVVYKGFQPELNRYVAVKILSPSLARNQSAVDEFLKAGETMSQLDQSGVLPVYDHGEQDGVYYIVARFIDGGALSTRLAFYNTPQEILGIFKPVSEALDYVHGRGVVHGNLKPSNILIDDGNQPLLADFGFGQRMVMGSMSADVHMSPEQAQGGDFDGRADVYALGVMLYEMVVGEEPPIGSLPSPRIKRPDLPEALEKVILKAMAQYPEQRYQSAGEFYRALSSALKPHPVAAPVVRAPKPATPPEPVSYPAPEPSASQDRSWLIFLLGGLVILAIICAAGAFFILFLNREDKTSAILTAEAATPSVTALADAPVRSGPGEEFEVVGVLPTGQTAQANAVTADGQWWGIIFAGAPSDQGWVSAALVTVQNGENVPVVEPPTLPTSTANLIPPSPTFTLIPPTATFTLPPPTPTPLPPTPEQPIATVPQPLTPEQPIATVPQPLTPEQPIAPIQPIAPTPTPDQGGGGSGICGLAGLPAVLLVVGIVGQTNRRRRKNNK